MNATASRWVFLSILTVSFPISAATVTEDRVAIQKYTRVQRTESAPLAKREAETFDVALKHFSQFSDAVSTVGLSASDATSLKLLSDNVGQLDVALATRSRQQLTTICTWPSNTDAVVLAAAIVAIDEDIENKRAERYETFLGGLSSTGRARLKAFLQSNAGSGVTSTVDLVALAAERPDLIQTGVAARCAKLKDPLNTTRKASQDLTVGLEKTP